MTVSFKVACVQTNSPREIDPSVEAACALARAARAEGADLILMPENVSMMEPDVARLRNKAAAQDDDRALAAFRDLARDTGAWLLVGSLPIRLSGDRVANRSFLLDSDGGIAAQYDKIHLFDVDLGSGEAYRESDERVPGNEAVVADTPWGKAGLAICYDLRFPELFRRYALDGARLMILPAEWPHPRRSHWRTLLRARAIENQCYVLACNRVGTSKGVDFFGSSAVIDPWGEALVEGGETETLLTVTFDPAFVDTARQRIPILAYRRQDLYK